MCGRKCTAHIATICRDAGAEAFRVGGVADHVHLITTLPRTHSLADLLEGLKKNLRNGSRLSRPTIDSSIGSATTTRFPRVHSAPSSNMWRPRRNTIAAVRFRKNTASSWANTTSSIMNVMYGIEVLSLPMNRAFSADYCTYALSWGSSPG